MNNRQANGRRRGRGGQRPQGGNPNQRDNGNRIDNRARGNAAQLLEKYKNLARDAQMQGDRVTTEYYLQFADHYFRVLSESRSRFEEQNQNRRPSHEMDGEEDGDDFEFEGNDERPERFSREDRGERSERDTRPDRNTRPERDMRQDREPRGDRDSRNEREPRADRDSRNDREPRADREARTDREPRGDVRAEREPRRNRDVDQDGYVRRGDRVANNGAAGEMTEASADTGGARRRPRREAPAAPEEQSESIADRLPPSFALEPTGGAGEEEVKPRRRRRVSRPDNDAESVDPAA
jgi:hypothetical protein